MVKIEVTTDCNIPTISKGDKYLCLCQRNDPVMKGIVHLDIQTNVQGEDALKLIMPYMEMFHFAPQS